MNALQITGIVLILAVVDFFILNWATRVVFGDAVAPGAPKSRVSPEIGFWVFCTSALIFFMLFILLIVTGFAAIFSH